MFEDSALPATRKVRRIGAEEQSRCAGRRTRGLEDASEAEARNVTNPAVRARRVEMHVGAGCDRREGIGEPPGPEVRNDERHIREGRRQARQRDGIAEGQIELAWQSELVPDAHREASAVSEHHSIRAFGRSLDHPQGAHVLQRHVVHGRKKADARQALLGERSFRARRRVGARGIDHEKADDPSRMPRHRPGDRRLVTRHAGNERRAAHAVRVQFAYPSVRQRVRIAGIVPLELAVDSRGIGCESLKERPREEMTVGVVNQV